MNIKQLEESINRRIAERELHKDDICVFCNGRGYCKDFYSLITGECHVCQGKGYKVYNTMKKGVEK